MTDPYRRFRPHLQSPWGQLLVPLLLLPLSGACSGRLFALPDDSNCAPNCPPPELCGNLRIDPDEQCDGGLLNSASCSSVGRFVGGVLGCTPNCLFDTANCEADSSCGNALINAGEECDGDNLRGLNCATAGAFTGGVLGCRNDCTYDFVNCSKPAPCGDGSIDSPEQCEGNDLNGNTCETVSGNFIGGTLRCRNDCRFDLSACETPPDCGNGTIDANEQCDGRQLNGNNCLTVPGGFVDGLLDCRIDCTFDTRACIAPLDCGNGTVEAGERCDGDDLDGNDCLSAGNFLGGELACNNSCDFDLSGCIGPANCGNGSIDFGEECDDFDFGGLNCSTIGGFIGGTLNCNADCTFNTVGCIAPEECGDGVKNSGEDCDGNDFGNSSCRTVAGNFTDGLLSCNNDCSFNTSQCIRACGIPGSQCSVDSDCCTFLCKEDAGGTLRCGDPSGCFSPGESCIYAGECCSLNCSGGLCVDDGSICGGSADPAESCSEDSGCCSNNCNDTALTCDPTGTGCAPAGDTCSNNGDCCSDVCEQGVDGKNRCAAFNLCRINGEICGSDSDCCTNYCIQNQSTGVFTCETLGADPKQCFVLGELCSTDPSCCSNACRLEAGDSNKKRCEFLGGCRVVGDLCARDADCCSFLCEETVDGVQRCSEYPGCDSYDGSIAAGFICLPGNIPTGSVCKQRGEVCQNDGECCEEGNKLCRQVNAGTLGGVKRCRQSDDLPCQASGEICAVPDDCCGGQCIQDNTGTFRCVGCSLHEAPCQNPADCCGGVCEAWAAYNGELRCGTEGAVCFPDGDPCIDSSDCCNDCQPDGTCGAQTACVGDFETCSASADCCLGFCFDQGGGPVCFPIDG